MNRSKNNKRAAAIVLAGVMAFSFVSCKKAELDTSSVEQISETTDTVSSSSSVSSAKASSAAKSSVPASSKQEEKVIMYVTGASQVNVFDDDKETTPLGALGSCSKVFLISKGTSDSYVQIESADGKLKGYIRSENLVDEKESVTSGEAVTVSATDQQVFELPGGKGAAIEPLSVGETLTLLAKTSGGYWRVRTGLGNCGYVAVTALMSDTSAESKTTEASKPSQTTTIIYDVGGNNADSGVTGNEGTAADTSEDTSVPDSAPSPASRVDTSSSDDYSSSDPNSALSSAVSTAQSKAGGNWSAAYIDLATGESTSVNSGPMQAASLIKLYIMGAVYERYDELAAQSPNIDGWLYSMITISDNTCANNLVSLLGGGDSDAGMQAVTSYAQSHGYGSTSMGRLLLAPAIYGDNYTSAVDCANFLQAAYNGQLPHSADMMNLLGQQTVTYKIPAGVPVRTANKTGELESVQNDAAVVYADKPYVLCVMSEYVSAGSAISAIVDLSAEVYASSK